MPCLALNCQESALSHLADSLARGPRGISAGKSFSIFRLPLVARLRESLAAIVCLMVNWTIMFHIWFWISSLHVQLAAFGTSSAFRRASVHDRQVISTVPDRFVPSSSSFIFLGLEFCGMRISGGTASNCSRTERYKHRLINMEKDIWLSCLEVSSVCRVFFFFLTTKIYIIFLNWNILVASVICAPTIIKFHLIPSNPVRHTQPLAHQCDDHHMK
jgi:hypothetical protein